jgi:hypothetical protein
MKLSATLLRGSTLSVSKDDPFTSNAIRSQGNVSLSGHHGTTTLPLCTVKRRIGAFEQ